MPTLLLTGSTGFIGSHLQKKFLAEGWKIVALVREIPTVAETNVEYIHFDLSAPEKLSLPENIDAFIHAAYLKQSKGIDSLHQNVAAAGQLLEATKNIPSRIFLSSLSARENALSIYGRQKYSIGKMFLANGGTVVQAGLVLGNGGLFAAMQKHLSKSRIIPLFGDGMQPVQTVHIDDLVEAVFKIVAEKRIGDFVIAEDTPVPYREFYAGLCKSLGVKPRFIRAGFGITSLAIGLANIFGITLPVTKENLLGLKQMERIESKTDLEKLGLQLRSWEESLRSVNNHGGTEISMD
jgi:nucleoside-diphosphate-sugar epimerase